MRGFKPVQLGINDDNELVVYVDGKYRMKLPGGGESGGGSASEEIIGTDPESTPLGITGAADQNQPFFLLKDSAGNWIIRVAGADDGGQISVWSANQINNDYSGITINDGVTVLDPDGITRINVTDGHVFLEIPEGDPHDNGALYKDAGVVKISSG